jgi:AcrR family transcriptional regulator
MSVDPEALPTAQHARLLEGLAESIREKGLAATQVADIVRHAHASRRTFYKHFADKESCFVELTEMLSSMLLTQVEGAIDRDAALATQIDQAVDTYVDLLMTDRGLTATFASASLGDRIVVAQRDAVERYAELLVSVVEANAGRDPEIAPVSLQRAYMLIAGCQQTIMRAVSRDEDLGEAAAEVKAVMKLALVGRAAVVG